VTDYGLLRLAYAANIIILVPVVWNMLSNRGGVTAVFEGSVEESPGLRIMVGSLWAAILVASTAGLVAPRLMAPILVVQVIYKATWLALFVWPLAQRTSWDAVPRGISLVFVCIVVSYPILLGVAWYQATRAV
jgi:hypothetical protein